MMRNASSRDAGREDASRPATVLGALAAAVGLLATLGWHAGRADLVRLVPAWAPLQYDAAACLALAGLGLAALGRERRRAAARLAAGAAAAAGWSVLRGALGVDFGLERLLSAPGRGAIPGVLRLEPLAAAALLLAAGVVLWRALSARRASAAAAAAGAALAGLGTVVFLCYVEGMASAFGWEHLTRVPPQAGLGLALLGAGLLARELPRRGQDAAGSRLPALAAGAGVATAALFLWAALHAEERVRVLWHVDAAASRLSSRIETARRGRGSLRPEELFALLRAEPSASSAFAVYLGRSPVYVSPGAPSPRPDEYARDVEVKVGGEAGWVRVWPSAELLRAESSRLPEAAGLTGLLLAVLLAWSVRLAQLARRQAREIDAASRAKSRFFANVSREFGNPLNAILGYSEVLLGRQDGPLLPEQEQDVRAIHEGGRRLASLMQQLLELARLESGKESAALAPVPGGAAVERLRREFAPQAEGKGLALRVEDGDDSAARADPERLHRALSLLVSNAVKFTPRGEVVLGARRDGREVVFSVRDTGAGLSPEEKDRLFEPFWQSRRLEGIKKTEGLGLGLHLAKRLVELQGGRLTADAGDGKGTTFRIWLPRDAAAKEETA